MSSGRESESDNGLCNWSGQNASGTTVECERPVEDDGILCFVHSPKIDTSEEVLSEIEQGEHLCGAVFQTVDLTCQVPEFTDNQPLDLTGARIDRLEIDNATISSAICLEDASIDEISANNAVVEGGLRATGLECKSLEASEVTIEGDLELTGATVEELLELTESRIECLDSTDLHVKGSAKLRINDCTFPEEVKINNSQISGHVTFRYSNFQGRVEIKSTVFESNIDCMFADFQSQVSFDKSEFKSTANFKQTRFGPFVTSFEGTRFGRSAIFSETVSSGVLSFSSPKSARDRDPAVFKNGVKFNDVNLYELRINGVNVDGELQLRQAQVDTLSARKIDSDAIRLDGAAIVDSVEFKAGTVGEFELLDSRFEGYSNFTDIKIRNWARIEQAVFQSDSDFEGASFIGDVSFERTRFAGQVGFESAEFVGRALFFGTRFEAPTTFADSRFYELGWFSRRGEQNPIPPATFTDEVSFHRAMFDTAVFNGVEFSESVRFDQASLGVDLIEEIGEGESFALDNTVNEDVTAVLESGESIPFDDWEPHVEHYSQQNEESEDTSITPSSHLEGANFDNMASFKGMTFGDDLVLDKASIEELRVSPTRVDDSITLYCKAATIASGTIEFNDESAQQYSVDFTATRLGNVDLLSGGTHSGVLDQCVIQNTEFNSFNFIPHLQELRELRWEIHHTDSDAPRLPLRKEWLRRAKDYGTILSAWWDDDSLDNLRDEYQNLQTTYQYAKTGANVTGQNEPASEFFQREMRYQTRNHLTEALSSEKSMKSRISPLIRSLLTLVFGVLSKHGESGMRVVESSVVIVFFYWIIYLARPDAGSGWFQQFVFSIGSFAALLTGNIGQDAGEITAFIASTEGFIGALMSALLLFTLTRSIHR